MTCIFGNATPYGNAMAVTAILKLAGFTIDLRYVDLAHQSLAQMQPMMAQYPLDFGRWLQALAYAPPKPREIAVIGDPNGADAQALLSLVRCGYRRFEMVALGTCGAQPSDVPLLQDRGFVDGLAAACVCRDFACRAPATEPVGIRARVESW